MFMNCVGCYLISVYALSILHLIDEFARLFGIENERII